MQLLNKEVEESSQVNAPAFAEAVKETDGTSGAPITSVWTGQSDTTPTTWSRMHSAATASAIHEDHIDSLSDLDAHCDGQDSVEEGLTELHIEDAACPRDPDDAGLPFIDERRFQFERVLTNAPRCGGQIELHWDRERETTVAIKRVPFSRLRGSHKEFRKAFPYEQEDPWQEFGSLRRLGGTGPERLPGVCACYGVYRDFAGDGLAVSEFLPDGDLFTYASTLPPPGPEREEMVWPIIESVLGTVRHLHAGGLAHGDVSLENALIRRCPGGKDLVYLTDFGMAVTGDLAAAQGVRGKPSYQAPEMHMEVQYDARLADLFACGVLAYALAIGNYPWSSTRPAPESCQAFAFAQGHGLEELLARRRIKVGNARATVNEVLSPRMRRLLLVLLDFDPPRRLLLPVDPQDAVPRCSDLRKPPMPEEIWGG